MSFCLYNSEVAVCNSERLVIFNIDSNMLNSIQLPQLQDSKTSGVPDHMDTELYHTITSIISSSDGKYFLICTNRKQLCLFDRKRNDFVLNKTLPRAASRVRFTPNNDIIVADKAGDAYLFSSTNSTESGMLLLGHLSMLLDILVTEDGKCIVTTDRDEKIRISMFPNSYNIVSYCLGHAKFVTNISELPHDKRILVSSGGDGIFILWDYKHGKELSRVSFSENVSKDEINTFNQILKNNHYDEHVNALPVKHLKLSMNNKTLSLLVISFYNSNNLLIYSIDGTLETNCVVTFIEKLILKEEPLDCTLKGKDLWILMDSRLEVYTFKENQFVIHSVLNNTLTELNKVWGSLRNNLLKQNLYHILYKRKYNNVQEYLERKKTRLVK